MRVSHEGVHPWGSVLSVPEAVWTLVAFAAVALGKANDGIFRWYLHAPPVGLCIRRRLPRLPRFDALRGEVVQCRQDALDLERLEYIRHAFGTKRGIGINDVEVQMRPS